jgi:hypothetical protein
MHETQENLILRGSRCSLAMGEYLENWQPLFSEGHHADRTRLHLPNWAPTKHSLPDRR